jgi:uncharacterized protein (DUF1501 family)
MTHHHQHLSRRQFLRASALGSVAGAAAPLALNLTLMNAAAAATASDYKALICLFFYGGNDAFNTLLPTDPSSWAEYQRWRNTGTEPLVLPGLGQPGGVLPITPLTAQPGRSFALNPRLVNTQRLFAARRLAWVNNVGPVTGPLDVSNYASGVAPFLPFALFSHNDQQAVWQSGRPEGASTGWAGRMGDLLAASNGTQTIFTSVAAQGGSVLLAGQSTIQYVVGRTAGATINGLARNSYGSSQSAALLRRIITRDSNHLFEKEAAAVARRAIDASAALSGAALPAGAAGVPNASLIYNARDKADVENPLAVQLQTVARIIGGSAALGLKRQLFIVGIGGFDTHSNQMPDHDWGMLQMDHALGYFDSALASLAGADVRDRVMLFSASDFGRTYSSNGNGTDHGFGAHHLVYGGGVKGGDLYGAMPPSGLGHAWDHGKGVLLPTQSVDQYAATFGRWLGLSAGQMLDLLPNLNRYTQRSLGFV